MALRQRRSVRPEEVHALAVKHGLNYEQAIIATAIAWAESQLKPDAIGDVDLENEKWGPSVGLWQVRSLRADTGTGKERDIERLGDPSFNARSMVAISNAGTNWKPWSVYTNGRYLKHIDAVRAAVTKGGTSVALVRGGITVKPHVQAFADACQAATGATSYGTYHGHSPPEGPTQALDIFNPDNAAGYALQDRIVEFARANHQRFGVRYIIRRCQIWNIERAGEGWRNQAATGNRTADHYDHVHITFYATAAAVPDQPTKPIPKPQPPEEDDDTMRLIGVTNNRGIFLVGTQPGTTKAAKGRIPAVHIKTPEEVQQLHDAGVAVRDTTKKDLPEAVFDRRFVVVQ